jgi:preprotein translocase subunit SecD
MSKRFRLILILVLMAVAFSFLYPSLQWYVMVPQRQKELAAGTRTQIRLYAEREAGIAMKKLLAMDVKAALPGQYSFLIDRAKERYRVEKRAFPRTWTVEDVLRGYPGREDLQVQLETHYREEIFGLKELRGRTIQLGLDLRGGIRVLIRADIETLEETQGKALTAAEREDAIRRALEILNNRIDQFGVTEPQIRRQGEDMILVELPGEADPERIRQFIQGKGQLTFHIVNEEGLQWFRQYQEQNPGAYITEQGEIRQPEGLPAGTELLGFYQKDAYGLDQLKGFTVVNQEVGLQGTYIRDAQIGTDPITAEPLVHFFLNAEGGDIFYKLTSANVNKTLAVVLDDKVKAQARIAEPIRDQVRVTGFNREEAADLALVLRTGALPVPLEIINQEAVGATLGEDAIRAGLNATMYAFALVVLFMLVYYKGAGLIADLALLLNLYLMVSILSVFNFTLTLPAIAGIVLTLGMAVDANVLIYERMKEEMALGKSAKAAVKAGFSKAFWAIADSNITTFIAALALSQLGKGPVQGFAVSLAVGIVCSMFTALIVSRLLFDFLTDVLGVSRLNISWKRVAA